MLLTIAVLSHNSLLAGGIASKLRERPDLFDVHAFDVSSADVHDALRAVNPAIVVVDAIDRYVATKLPISELLSAVPTAKVVQLECNSNHIRIFSTEKRRARDTGELIDMIRSIGSAQTELIHA